MNNKRDDVIFELIRTAVAILISVVLALVIIVFVSHEPADALKAFFIGPFTSIRRFGNIIEMMIPLIFTGLAVCVMFQASQFNMVAEGSFYIGGVMATFAAFKFNLPPVVLPIAAILFGGLFGAIGGFIPGILKAKWNASELVSSLMLNYILFYAGMYILNYYLRDPKAGITASHLLKSSAKLVILVPKTKIHFGLIIALLAVAVVYYFLYRSKHGYCLRMTGLNQQFAKYSGMNTSNIIMYSQVIGGFIAGIGGSVQLLGMYDRFTWDSLPGYGFDGIIIAILARNNPLLVPVAAFFLAYLRTGANTMAMMADVPSEVISIIQAIMIMLIAANAFLAGWRHRMIVKKSKEKLALKGDK